MFQEETEHFGNLPYGTYFRFIDGDDVVCVCTTDPDNGFSFRPADNIEKPLYIEPDHDVIRITIPLDSDEWRNRIAVFDLQQEVLSHMERVEWLRGLIDERQKWGR